MNSKLEELVKQYKQTRSNDAIAEIITLVKHKVETTVRDRCRRLQLPTVDQEELIRDLLSIKLLECIERYGKPKRARRTTTKNVTKKTKGIASFSTVFYYQIINNVLCRAAYYQRKTADGYKDTKHGKPLSLDTYMEGVDDGEEQIPRDVPDRKDHMKDLLNRDLRMSIKTGCPKESRFLDAVFAGASIGDAVQNAGMSYLERRRYLEKLRDDPAIMELRKVLR